MQDGMHLSSAPLANSFMGCVNESRGSTAVPTASDFSNATTPLKDSCRPPFSFPSAPPVPVWGGTAYPSPQSTPPAMGSVNYSSGGVGGGGSSSSSGTMGFGIASTSAVYPQGGAGPHGLPSHAQHKHASHPHPQQYSSYAVPPLMHASIPHLRSYSSFHGVPTGGTLVPPSTSVVGEERSNISPVTPSALSSPKLRLPNPVSFSPFKDCFDGLLRPFEERVAFEVCGVRSKRQIQMCVEEAIKHIRCETLTTTTSDTPSAPALLSATLTPSLATGPTTATPCTERTTAPLAPSSMPQKVLSDHHVPCLSSSSENHLLPVIRIGVDGNYFISQTLFRFHELDPFWSLHSSCPEEILLRIGSFVLECRERRMEPVFVFQGVGANLDSSRVASSVLSPPATRNIVDVPSSVWSQLEQRKLPSMKDIFGEDEGEATEEGEGISPLKVTEDVVYEVQRYLRLGKFSSSRTSSSFVFHPDAPKKQEKGDHTIKGTTAEGEMAKEEQKGEYPWRHAMGENEGPVMCITAPFLHWSQLVTLHIEKYVTLLIGPLDMLLLPYPPMELITHLDFETEEATYIRRAAVVQTLFPRLTGRAVAPSVLSHLEKERTPEGSPLTSDFHPTTQTVAEGRDGNALASNERNPSSTEIGTLFASSSIHSPSYACLGDYLLMILGILRGREVHVNIFPSGCAVGYPLHQLKDVLYQWGIEEDLARVEENVLELIDVCEHRQLQPHATCESGGAGLMGTSWLCGGSNSSSACSNSSTGYVGDVHGRTTSDISGALGISSAYSAPNSLGGRMNSTMENPITGLSRVGSVDPGPFNRRQTSFGCGNDSPASGGQDHTTLSTGNGESASRQPIRLEVMGGTGPVRVGVSRILYKKCRDYVLFNTVFSVDGIVKNNTNRVASLRATTTAVNDHIIGCSIRTHAEEAGGSTSLPHLISPPLDSFYRVLARGKITRATKSSSVLEQEERQRMEQQEGRSRNQHPSGAPTPYPPPSLYLEKYSSLDGVLGDPVPPALLFLQMTGTISVCTMTIVMQSYFVRSRPLVDTEDYRKLLPGLKTFRLQGFYQLLESIFPLPASVAGPTPESSMTTALPLLSTGGASCAPFQEGEGRVIGQEVPDAPLLDTQTVQEEEDKRLHWNQRLEATPASLRAARLSSLTGVQHNNWALHPRTLAWICWSTPQPVIYSPPSGRIQLSEWNLEELLRHPHHMYRKQFLENGRTKKKNAKMREDTNREGMERKTGKEMTSPRMHERGNTKMNSFLPATTVAATKQKTSPSMSSRSLHEGTEGRGSTTPLRPVLPSSLTLEPPLVPTTTTTSVVSRSTTPFLFHHEDAHYSSATLRSRMHPAMVLSMNTKYCCIPSPFRWQGSATLSPALYPAASAVFHPLSLDTSKKDNDEKEVEKGIASGVEKRILIRDGNEEVDGNRELNAPALQERPTSEEGPHVSSADVSAVVLPGSEGGLTRPARITRTAVTTTGGAPLYKGRENTMLALRLRAFDFMGYFTHSAIVDSSEEEWDSEDERNVEEWLEVEKEREEGTRQTEVLSPSCAAVSPPSDEVVQDRQGVATCAQEAIQPVKETFTNEDHKDHHAKKVKEGLREKERVTENREEHLSGWISLAVAGDAEEEEATRVATADDMFKSKRKEEGAKKEDQEEEEDDGDTLSSASTRSGYVSSLFGDRFSFQSLLCKALSHCPNEFHDGLILCTELLRIHPPVLHSKPYEFHQPLEQEHPHFQPFSFFEKSCGNWSPGRHSSPSDFPGTGFYRAPPFVQDPSGASFSRVLSGTASAFMAKEGLENSRGVEPLNATSRVPSMSLGEDRLVPSVSCSLSPLAPSPYPHGTSFKPSAMAPSPATAMPATAKSTPALPTPVSSFPPSISVVEEDAILASPTYKPHPHPPDSLSPTSVSCGVASYTSYPQTPIPEGERSQLQQDTEPDVEELHIDLPEVLLLSRIGCLCSVPYSYRTIPSPLVSSKNRRDDGEEEACVREQAGEGKETPFLFSPSSRTGSAENSRTNSFPEDGMDSTDKNMNRNTVKERAEMKDGMPKPPQLCDRDRERDHGDDRGSEGERHTLVTRNVKESDMKGNVSHGPPALSRLSAPLTTSGVSTMDSQDDSKSRVFRKDQHHKVGHSDNPLQETVLDPSPLPPHSSSSFSGSTTDFLSPSEAAAEDLHATTSSSYRSSQDLTRLLSEKKDREVLRKEEEEVQAGHDGSYIPTKAEKNSRKGHRSPVAVDVEGKVNVMKEEKHSIEADKRIELDAIATRRVGKADAKRELHKENVRVEVPPAQKNGAAAPDQRFAETKTRLGEADLTKRAKEDCGREVCAGEEARLEKRHGSLSSLTPPIAYRPFDWAPLYSPQLCAFFGMATTLCRDMREMTKCLIASMFLKGVSSCSLAEFGTFTAEDIFPFSSVPMNTIGGLLLHYVLVFPDDYQNECDTPESRIAFLSNTFAGIANLSVQLERVMRFTFEALYLLRAYYYGTSMLKEKCSPAHFAPHISASTDEIQGIEPVIEEEDQDGPAFSKTNFEKRIGEVHRIRSYVQEDVLEFSLTLLQKKWTSHFGDGKAFPKDHFAGMVERAQKWRNTHGAVFEMEYV